MRVARCFSSHEENLADLSNGLGASIPEDNFCIFSRLLCFQSIYNYYVNFLYTLFSKSDNTCKYCFSLSFLI